MDRFHRSPQHQSTSLWEALWGCSPGAEWQPSWPCSNGWTCQATRGGPSWAGMTGAPWYSQEQVAEGPGSSLHRQAAVWFLVCSSAELTVGPPASPRACRQEKAQEKGRERCSSASSRPDLLWTAASTSRDWREGQDHHTWGSLRARSCPPSAHRPQADSANQAGPRESVCRAGPAVRAPKLLTFRL